MFVKVEMFDIQKCALQLLFSDFDVLANLQGRFGRFANLALCLVFLIFSSPEPKAHKVSL